MNRVRLAWPLSHPGGRRFEPG